MQDFDYMDEDVACLLGLYDACIVGIGYRFSSGPLAVYSIPMVLKVMEGWGMDEEEAQEYFEYNTIGAWMGDGTPMFIYPFLEDTDA